jgi:hypothetical protein
MSESLPLSLISPKLAELADLLQRASSLARELSLERQLLRLTIPDLKRPQDIPNDQAWFWTKTWQAGEHEVNQQFQNGEYEVYPDLDSALAALDRQA